MAATWTDPPSGDAPAGDATPGDGAPGDAPAGDAPAGDAPAGEMGPVPAGTEHADRPGSDDQRTPDVPAAVELDRVEADLSRVSESLRLLDQEDVEPAQATAWLAVVEVGADVVEGG